MTSWLERSSGSGSSYLAQLRSPGPRRPQNPSFRRKKKVEKWETGKKKKKHHTAGIIKAINPSSSCQQPLKRRFPPALTQAHPTRTQGSFAAVALQRRGSAQPGGVPQALLPDSPPGASDFLLRHLLGGNFSSPRLKTSPGPGRTGGGRGELLGCPGFPPPLFNKKEATKGAAAAAAGDDDDAAGRGQEDARRLL